MTRSILTSFLIIIALSSYAQTKVVSLGVFTGITSSYTWDEGINKDPRYKIKYDIKFAPIGFNYGVDYKGFGFVVSPSIINIGQNFHVINTVGGHEGVRKINMQYANLPIALKIHIIDLSFFRVSFIAGGSIAYKLNAAETISHNDAKLKFPASVYPILPPDYIVEYDGVLSPAVARYKMLKKEDFNSLQIFASLGMRSDWDVTEKWKISFDVRVNYGILETRSDQYLTRLNASQTLYDIPGNRRETFGYLTIGISRYIEIEKKEKERQQRAKGSSHMYTPKKYPWPGPKKSKPKG